jgi:hypothetical protein
MSSRFSLLLKYGAIISLPMILLSVIAYVFVIENSSIFEWMSIIVFIATIFIVQKMFVKEQYDDGATYSQLLGSTVIMLVFASFIMLIYSYLFYEYFAPDQIDRILQLAEDSLWEQGFSEKEIDQSMVYVSKINSPIGLSVMSLFSTFFQGFLIALIVGIVNKKKSGNSFDEVMKDVSENDEK